VRVVGQVKWGKVISGNVKVGQVYLSGVVVAGAIEVLGIRTVLWLAGFSVLEIVGLEVLVVGGKVGVDASVDLGVKGAWYVVVVPDCVDMG